MSEANEGSKDERSESFGAESREYPPERPRATGGFLKRLGNTDSSTRPRKRDSKRAQTSIDFVVGASVFLLTVAFVVAFLPGVFEPFTGGGEGDVVSADRTASLVAEQLLADPTNPGNLNATCTEEFFDADGSVGDCSFDADADDLDAALGLGATTSVNVTVEENASVRSVNGVPLRAGPEPPESQSVVVSRRVVVLDGEESDLYVRVW